MGCGVRMKFDYPVLPEIVSNTLVDYPRLYNLRQYLFETRGVFGDIAEVGVYKGGTALLICQETKGLKEIFLFDTFAGMPKVDANKDLHKQGDFADTSLEAVKALLNDYNPEIYQGLFPFVTGDYVDKHYFSLVHLDVDIYTSVKECLEFFYPRMAVGGIIVLDDYLEPNCPGAKLAADEFALAKGIQIEATTQSQAIIRI